MMESAKQLEERLLYTREYAVQDEQTNEKAHVFCEDYKQFLNQGKTEREVVIKHSSPAGVISLEKRFIFCTAKNVCSQPPLAVWIWNAAFA